MRKHKLLSAFAVGAVMALAAGCTGGTGGGSASDQPKTDGEIKGEITFQTWSLKNEKFTPYFEKLVKDFETQHPGVKIKWIDQPGDGYEEKVLQQANSGELPDVVNLPDTFAYQLAKVDKLLDLKKADPDLEKNYVKGGLDGYTFEGMDGTWAYPWYLGTDLDWWNMDQLKEAGFTTAPKSFDEFAKMAKEAAEKTGKKVQLVSSLPGTDSLTANGIALMKDGKFAFNTDEAAKIVQTYADLYAAGAMPAEVLNGDYAGNASMFTQGKVGYTTATPSFVTQLKNDAPSMIKSVDVTERYVTPPLFVQGISVAKESKNLPTALAFAKFVTNNANQVEFVKLAQGFLPGTKEANEHADQLTKGIDDPLLEKAVKLAAGQMKRAQGTQFIQFSDEMKKYTDGQIALAIQGKISPKEALDNAVKHCNDGLDK